MISHWIVRSWKACVAVWTAVLAVIGIVGFTRIYLGVHYLSDVIAGWVLGAAWAAALVGSALLVEPWVTLARGRRQTPHRHQSGVMSDTE